MCLTLANIAKYNFKTSDVLSLVHKADCNEVTEYGCIITVNFMCISLEAES